MARITLHVGLPKTGSSAIQTWLRYNQLKLSEHGIRLVVARPNTRTGQPEVTPYTEGSASSGGIVHLLRHKNDRERATSSLVTQMQELADHFGHIVLSGEGLSQLFWRHDRVVLDQLDSLGANHHCEVAYYMGPQHRALEAAWRQWGFRSGHRPAEYLRRRTRHLHYQDMLSVVDEVPRLHVKFRCFERNMLPAGDVVRDFVSVFLGIHSDDVQGPVAANVGLSLVTANLLSTVPGAILWSSPHDNQRFSRIRNVLQGITVTDPRAEAGRRVLERWTLDQFGDENAILLRAMGWSPEGWPRDDGGEDRDISRLDSLWRPSASAAELAILHRLLEQLVKDV